HEEAPVEPCSSCFMSSCFTFLLTETHHAPQPPHGLDRRPRGFRADHHPPAQQAQVRAGRLGRHALPQGQCRAEPAPAPDRRPPPPDPPLPPPLPPRTRPRPPHNSLLR